MFLNIVFLYRNVRASTDMDGLGIIRLNRPETIRARGEQETTSVMQPAANVGMDAVEFCWQCVPLPRHGIADVISMDWLDLAAVAARRQTPDDPLTMRMIQEKYCGCKTPKQTAAALYVTPKLASAQIHDNRYSRRHRRPS